MQKGQRVKINSNGFTGTVVAAMEKLLNVTIDEKHLQPGDDPTVYLKPDDVEILEEVAAEEKETATAETISADVQTLPDEERVSGLLKDVFALNEENGLLKKQNEELKAVVAELNRKIVDIAI